MQDNISSPIKKNKIGSLFKEVVFTTRKNWKFFYFQFFVKLKIFKENDNGGAYPM